ncbi:MAG TPA: pilus assembly protein TadG-related protein [Caproiciproducens sp.]|nr:pilus assembly protein TadG-related protein [Caproiciproducens sp.]
MLSKIKRRENERGQVMVLFALLVTVLIGIGALTVDIGRMAVVKSNLQNAVDAAALAAVNDLPDEAASRNSAEEYAGANGIGSPVTVLFSDSSRKVTVTASQPVEYTFAKVIGFQSANVTVKAAATLSDVLYPYKYALFSGSNIDLLTMTGQNRISGDIHSNNSIVINGQTDVDGTVTAVGNIDNSGLTATAVKSSSNISMPDFSDVLDKAYTYTNGSSDLTLTADELNSLLSTNAVVYYNGSLTIDGSGINSSGCMIVSGDITFHGSGVSMSSAASVCLCSLNGNITFDGGGESMSGIIYAPNGTVTLNGKSDQLYGSIIANEINSNGGMNVTYQDWVANKSIPPTVRRLAE